MNRETYEKLRRADVGVEPVDGLRKQAKRAAKRDFWAKRREQMGKPDAEKVAAARKRRARMREARRAVAVR